MTSLVFGIVSLVAGSLALWRAEKALAAARDYERRVTEGRSVGDAGLRSGWGTAVPPERSTVLGTVDLEHARKDH